MKVKHEKLFIRLYDPSCFGGGPRFWTAMDLGRKQFQDHQSRGIEPRFPVPFFKVLTSGKKHADFLLSEYRKAFLNNQGEVWFDHGGLYGLWQDWKGDRWVLKYLLRWWARGHTEKLPQWIFCECAFES